MRCEPRSQCRPGLEPERRDAARNRELLLRAARELIEECGADGLTMDTLAQRAGVGKGTVFRRFGSRAGLMMTLLSDAEAEFQGRFMFGPPPLGPGAPPLERLIAFGEERIAWVLEFGELARAADVSAYNRFDVPAAVLWHRHLEMLLREAGVDCRPLADGHVTQRRPGAGADPARHPRPPDCPGATRRVLARARLARRARAPSPTRIPAGSVQINSPELFITI